MKKTNPKERILQVAVKLFHENGYNTTGINTIIEQAKVAKASFYDHYKTKEDLAIAYLHYRHTFWFDGLKKSISKELTVEEQIYAAFQYIIDMNLKENYIGCAFLNLLAELPLRQGKLYDEIYAHKVALQHYFQNLIPNPSKAFLIYMLFESCLTESQVYQSNECIEKTILFLKSEIL